MRGGRELETETVRVLLNTCELRSFCPEDAPTIAFHANNRRVWINLRDRFPHPYAPEDAEEFIHAVTTTPPESHFAIVVDGVAVGAIGLMFHGDVYRRSAEVGYWLGEPHWSRGIATEALRFITDWGFERIDLCRIYACVFEWNPASVRVLEKAGYEVEGRHRKAVTKDERTLDQIVLAVVR